MTLSTFWLRRLLAPALSSALLFQACGADDSRPNGHGAAGEGASDPAGKSGGSSSGGQQSSGGTSGTANDAGDSGAAGHSDAAGAGGEGNLAGAGGASEPPTDRAQQVETGSATVTRTPRPSYGALLAASD